MHESYFVKDLLRKYNRWILLLYLHFKLHRFILLLSFSVFLIDLQNIFSLRIWALKRMHKLWRTVFKLTTWKYRLGISDVSANLEKYTFEIRAVWLFEIFIMHIINELRNLLFTQPQAEDDYFHWVTRKFRPDCII